MGKYIHRHSSGDFEVFNSRTEYEKGSRAKAFTNVFLIPIIIGILLVLISFVGGLDIATMIIGIFMIVVSLVGIYMVKNWRTNNRLKWIVLIALEIVSFSPFFYILWALMNN